MSQEEPEKKRRLQSDPLQVEKTKVAAEAPIVEETPPKILTPEEQMALYEKDLKENDWGHQPC